MSARSFPMNSQAFSFASSSTLPSSRAACPPSHLTPVRHVAPCKPLATRSQPRMMTPGQGNAKNLIIPSGSFSAGGNSKGGSAPSLYLPFRRPLPEDATGLSHEEKLEILRDRQGLWHELAPLVASLIRSGVGPLEIEEATGITGVEQNTLAVSAQVYTTLKATGCEENVLNFFDSSGAEILYELRVIAEGQRASAAKYVVDRGMDGKAARELAKAMKEFERRGRDEARKSFRFTPADCMAYACYRQSLEVRSPAEKLAAINLGLSHAESADARMALEEAAKAVPASGPRQD